MTVHKLSLTRWKTLPGTQLSWPELSKGDMLHGSYNNMMSNVGNNRLLGFGVKPKEKRKYSFMDNPFFVKSKSVNCNSCPEIALYAQYFQNKLDYHVVHH